MVAMMVMVIDLGWWIWWLEEKKSGFGGGLVGFGRFFWVSWVNGGVAMLVVVYVTIFG